MRPRLIQLEWAYGLLISFRPCCHNPCMTFMPTDPASHRPFHHTINSTDFVFCTMGLAEDKQAFQCRRNYWARPAIVNQHWPRHTRMRSHHSRAINSGNLTYAYKRLVSWRIKQRNWHRSSAVFSIWTVIKNASYGHKSILFWADRATALTRLLLRTGSESYKLDSSNKLSETFTATDHLLTCALSIDLVNVHMKNHYSPTSN